MMSCVSFRLDASHLFEIYDKFHSDGVLRPCAAERRTSRRADAISGGRASLRSLTFFVTSVCFSRVRRKRFAALGRR